MNNQEQKEWDEWERYYKVVRDSIFLTHVTTKYEVLKLSRSMATLKRKYKKSGKTVPFVQWIKENGYVVKGLIFDTKEEAISFDNSYDPVDVSASNPPHQPEDHDGA